MNNRSENTRIHRSVLPTPWKFFSDERVTLEKGKEREAGTGRIKIGFYWHSSSISESKKYKYLELN